jgi:hypothetical protein
MKLIRIAVNAILAAIAAAMLFLVSLPAFGQTLSPEAWKDTRWRVEFSLGQGRYERSPPGMWWQDDHDNPSKYKDNKSWEAGLSYKLNSTFGLSARLVHIGWAHTRARATTCPLDDCTKRDHSLDFRRAECPLAFNDNNCMYE